MHQRLESIPKLGTCVTGLLNFSAGFAIATAFNCWSVQVIFSMVKIWTYNRSLYLDIVWVKFDHNKTLVGSPLCSQNGRSITFCLFPFCFPRCFFLPPIFTLLTWQNHNSDFHFLILGFVVSGNHISEPGTSRRSLFCLWQWTKIVCCVPLRRCLYRASESKVFTK